MPADQQDESLDAVPAQPRPSHLGSAAVQVKIEAYMRLSRHARNEMRLYSVASEDVEATISDPVTREVDDRGNARLAGITGDGRPILVVVATNDPDFVITVFPRNR